jgi:hypothetical protein
MGTFNPYGNLQSVWGPSIRMGTIHLTEWSPSSRRVISEVFLQPRPIADESAVREETLTRLYLIDVREGGEGSAADSERRWNGFKGKYIGLRN